MTMHVITFKEKRLAHKVKSNVQDDYVIVLIGTRFPFMSESVCVRICASFVITAFSLSPGSRATPQNLRVCAKPWNSENMAYSWGHRESVSPCGLLKQPTSIIDAR